MARAGGLRAALPFHTARRRGRGSERIQEPGKGHLRVPGAAKKEPDGTQPPVSGEGPGGHTSSNPLGPPGRQRSTVSGTGSVQPGPAGRLPAWGREGRQADGATAPSLICAHSGHAGQTGPRGWLHTPARVWSGPRAHDWELAHPGHWVRFSWWPAALQGRQLPSCLGARHGSRTRSCQRQRAHRGLVLRQRPRLLDAVPGARRPANAKRKARTSQERQRHRAPPSRSPACPRLSPLRTLGHQGQWGTPRRVP